MEAPYAQVHTTSCVGLLCIHVISLLDTRYRAAHALSTGSPEPLNPCTTTRSHVMDLRVGRECSGVEMQTPLQTQLVVTVLCAAAKAPWVWGGWHLRW